jgi:hypothetical protein
MLFSSMGGIVEFSFPPPDRFFNHAFTPILSLSGRHRFGSSHAAFVYFTG